MTRAANSPLKWSLIFLLAFVLGLLFVQTAQAQVVSFAKEVEVAAEEVYLLDLVDPARELTPAMEYRLAEIKVSDSPELGNAITISGARLRDLVEKADLGAGVTVLLAPEVIVSRAANRVTPEDLAKAYEQAIQERLSGDQVIADIHSIETGRGYILPQGLVELKTRLMTTTPSGRTPAMVEVWLDGHKMAQARVVGQVDLYGEAVVAIKPLLSGHIVGPEDVELRRINLAEVGAGMAAEISQVTGMKLRSSVPMGGALDIRRLERSPLIVRGAVVTMICDTGGIKVTAKGKAEQTGYLNSRIKLINLASKREVYGTVLDSGTVLVEF